jgi:hypothetical protein
MLAAGPPLIADRLAAEQSQEIPPHDHRHDNDPDHDQGDFPCPFAVHFARLGFVRSESCNR